MKPDRRAGLRRLEDASFRTAASHDNEALKERIKALESLLARAGEKLSNYDSDYPPERFEVYDLVERIDAILPKTEEVKDEV